MDEKTDNLRMLLESDGIDYRNFHIVRVFVHIYGYRLQCCSALLYVAGYTRAIHTGLLPDVIV